MDVQRTARGFDILRDLHDLYLLSNESYVSGKVLDQAATALQDEPLKAALTGEPPL